MYINTTTLQYPINYGQLRVQNPNVSMANPPTEGTLVALGYAEVRPIEKPTEGVVTEGAPEKVLGVWRQTWTVRPFTEIERAAAESAKAEKVQAEVVAATQARLDAFAQTRTYDDVNSMSKYKDITDAEIATLPLAEQAFVTKFRAECRYLALMTARTWARLYIILDEVQVGTRPMPAGFADIEPDLPALAWPV